MTILEAIELTKIYTLDDQQILVLDHISLSIEDALSRRQSCQETLWRAGYHLCASCLCYHCSNTDFSNAPNLEEASFHSQLSSNSCLDMPEDYP